jgi:EAL domain-containing protein (putative c-di-GMP-specific phosphodiesterase class I)
VIHAILSLARSLRMKTVAEGVETEEQRQALLQMGCGAMQGYLFGKPMRAKEIEKMFGAERTEPVASIIPLAKSA